MGNTYSSFFPPSPSLVEDNLPRQDGRVFIVTGGYSGVGYELSGMLWRAGGTVYIAGRDQAKAQAAMTSIKATANGSRPPGQVHCLQVSLDDFESIRNAASRFLTLESRLDVLFNNAGVSNPPVGSLSV